MAFEGKFIRPATVPAGTHHCALEEVNDCQMAVWEDGVKQDGMTKPGLAFVFQVQYAGAFHTLKKEVTKTVGPKGNLYKLLKGMLGEKFKPEILQSDDRTTKAIDWCIGKEFLIQTELSTSGYTKVISVMAMPEAGAAPIAAVRAVPATTPAANDKTGFESLPDVVPANFEKLPF